MSTYKILGQPVPNVPWQEGPDCFSGAPVWRYSENPIIGRNPVTEALKSGHEMEKLVIAKGSEKSLGKIIAMAKDRGVPVYYQDRQRLDAAAEGGAHQGVAAWVSGYTYSGIEEILQRAEEKGEDPLVVLLDGIEDPHNLGAIIRSADGAGAHGVIIPKRRAVSVTPAVIKASAGASEHLAVARVPNLAAAIETLKKNNIWIYALEADGEPYYRKDFSDTGCALVLGSEGDGLSRIVRESADFVVSVPMYGGVGSLNVSAAAAVVLFEAARQRHRGE